MDGRYDVICSGSLLGLPYKKIHSNSAGYDRIAHQFVVELKGALRHRVPMGADPAGNVTRLDNRLDSMDELLTTAKAQLSHLEHQLETAKEDVQKTFPQEAELAEKTERLNVLNALLNVDHKENELADTDPEPADPPQRSRKGQER